MAPTVVRGTDRSPRRSGVVFDHLDAIHEDAFLFTDVQIHGVIHGVIHYHYPVDDGPVGQINCRAMRGCVHYQCYTPSRRARIHRSRVHTLGPMGPTHVRR